VNYFLALVEQESGDEVQHYVQSEYVRCYVIQNNMTITTDGSLATILQYFEMPKL